MIFCLFFFFFEFKLFLKKGNNSRLNNFELTYINNLIEFNQIYYNNIWTTYNFKKKKFFFIFFSLKWKGKIFYKKSKLKKKKKKKKKKKIK